MEEIHFTIYEQRDNEIDNKTEKILIEQYTFNIQWHDDSGIAEMDISWNHNDKNKNNKKVYHHKKLVNKKDIERQTRDLLFQMMSLNNCLKHLPQNPSYSVQLFYNKTCPKSYKPPGNFRCVDGDQSSFILKSKILKQKMGKINTNHSTFRVGFKTTEDRLLNNDQDQEDDDDDDDILDTDFESDDLDETQKSDISSVISSIYYEPQEPAIKKRRISSMKSQRITLKSQPNYKKISDEIIERFVKNNPYSEIDEIRKQFPNVQYPKILKIYNTQRNTQRNSQRNTQRNAKRNTQNSSETGEEEKVKEQQSENDNDDNNDDDDESDYDEDDDIEQDDDDYDDEDRYDKFKTYVMDKKCCTISALKKRKPIPELSEDDIRDYLNRMKQENLLGRYGNAGKFYFKFNKKRKRSKKK